MTFRVPTQQYSFTTGMLDDTMDARSDTRAYFSGAKELKNFLGLPQGGIDMRGGFNVVAELPEAAAGARMASFEFSTEQKYLHVFTDQKLHVFRNDNKEVSVDMPWTGAQLPELDWTQSLDTMILVHPDVIYKKIVRQGAHDAWGVEDLSIDNIPQYDFDGDGSNPEEDTWSNARGWPLSVYLLEGRLYFGGSRERPQTIWGSSSNNFFDFNQDTSTDDQPLADDGVEMTLDSDRVSAIEQLYALDDFFAFTSGGIFAQTETPITPDNFYFSRNAEMPAAKIRPVELDGSLFFLRRGKDGHHMSLQELVYDDGKQRYTTQDISLLSSSLMRSPVAMFGRMGNESDSANHLFVINGDGTIAVLNTRKSQQITGWSLIETYGEVLDGCNVGNVAYFLVKRNIGGTDRYFIERLDPDRVLDCSVYQTSEVAKSNWDGLDHLEGQVIDLFGDGFYLGQATVTGGSVTTSYDVFELEAGFAFDWAAETMPIEAQLQDGTLIGNRHRIVRATLRLKNTMGELSVKSGRSDVKMTFRKLGDELLDQPPTPFNGLKEAKFLGWSGGRHGQGATIRCEGRSTGRATILSITGEVAQ